MWMFYSLINNNIVRKLAEQCNRLVYKNKMSIYEELIDKDSLIFIHQRNIWALVAKLIKMKNGSPPGFGSKISVHETKSHDLKQSNG